MMNIPSRLSFPKFGCKMHKTSENSFIFVHLIQKDMNKKTLIIHIGIACLLATLTCLSYFNTRKRMLEVAERTFVEAVHLELDERWKSLGETVTIVSGKDKEVYTNFSIKKKGVEKNYSLKDLDYEHNIDNDINRRMFHSVLSDLPLMCHTDTLISIWQSLLSEERIKTSVNVAVVDSGQDVRILRDSLSIGSLSQSLPTRYAGVANEIQLNGFIRLSIFDVFRYQLLLSLYVGLLIVWIVFVAWNISSENRFLTIPKREGCRLAQNVVYDSDARCFIKDSQKIILSPKGNLIIKALLEAENHELHGADLLAQVWSPKETNMNKLYIQNSKLRTILKALGEGFDIVSMDRSHFRFIFPNMQEKHNILET